MKLDPAVMKTLLETFEVELQQQAQIMTDGLLAVERETELELRKGHIDRVFRAAHNIKGAARGVDLSEIGDLAHGLESVLSAYRHTEAMPDRESIDLCLGCVDRIRDAWNTRIADVAEGLPFNLPEWLLRLRSQAEAISSGSRLQETAQQHSGGSGVSVVNEARNEDFDYAIRVAMGDLQAVASLVEDIVGLRVAFEDHWQVIRGVNDRIQRYLQASLRRAATPMHGFEASRPISGEDACELMTDISYTLYAMQRAMRVSAKQFSHAAAALQGEVNALRLVPIAQLLRPLARTLRDLSRDLGKEATLQTSGGDVSLDRAVFDRLRDPLMHLVRNAVDHGIETPAERLACGKPREGQVRISVVKHGGEVELRIEDDGAGIDPEEISRLARERGLVTDRDLQALTSDQRLQLIFLPGFSTREQVTAVSGRGVGLDVVAASVRALKGLVRVESRPGDGAVFSLRLPINLSTDHGVFVRVGAVTYALPALAIDRIVESDGGDFISIDGRNIFMMDGKAVPVRSLAAAVGQSEGLERESPFFLVLLNGSHRTQAFIVDDVLGEREMVVKPLLPPLASIRNVRGATLTASGGVVIVLDPDDLLETPTSATERLATFARRGKPSPRGRVLVVDDSITIRMLQKQVLEGAGYEVITAVDGEQGWSAAQRELFDLIITDIEMPGIDGFELTARIKAGGQRDVPVIIVTSLGQEHHRRRGVEVGADAYIVKSRFETQILLDAVDRLLSVNVPTSGTLRSEQQQ